MLQEFRPDYMSSNPHRGHPWNTNPEGKNVHMGATDHLIIYLNVYFAAFCRSQIFAMPYAVP